MLGYGLLKAAHPDVPDAQIWEKIAVIDTENKSGSLYVGTTVGGTHIDSFNTIDLEPPFTAARYLEAIQVAGKAGMEFLIIDSLSHAWAGEGGLLEVQGAIAKRTGNSYTAWRDVTPQYNKLLDAILQSDMHIAVTLRSKTEYTIEENDRGKKAPRKIGTEPIMRSGAEYEFTTFLDIGLDHMAAATKDRTMLFDGQIFQITPDTGAKIYAWLTNNGSTPIPPATKARAPEPDASLAEQVDAAVKAACSGLTGEEKAAVAEEIKKITGGIANYKTITEEAVLRALLARFGEGVA